MTIKVINLGSLPIVETGTGSFSFKISDDNPNDPIPVYNIAQGFYLAAKRCATNVKLQNGQIEYLLIPSVVTFCFSCELFMKSIYLKNNNETIRGHDLKKLFDELPSDIKRGICDSLSSKISGINPTDLITEISKSFVHARYDFENLIKIYREYEIEIFAKSLYQEAATMLGKQVLTDEYLISKI